MADDYTNPNSMLDEVDAVDEEKAIQEAVQKAEKRSFKTVVKNITGGSANFGTKILAGGKAMAQTTSATSLVAIFGVVLGLTSGVGDDFTTQFRDDYLPNNPYECLDEYQEAYRGVFGTINETPLAEQHSAVVERLKEINEWSKTYVGQDVPKILVCDESDCPYYGHTGCPDGDHSVRKIDDETITYIDSGARIDLSNVRRIHDFYSSYGLTDVQIAAICGVMTIESRIDFTSVEGYNIQGERYNLDPSVATDEFAFKPYAEGINSSIETPTCIHELIANPYTGPDEPIDYAAYSAKYPSIHKLGIGTVGFTDGPGFYNNTFLRNYADYLNDRVNLIQNIVEGSRGWREELRQRAADTYHVAYGAEGEDKRGTANKYIEKVDLDTLLFFKDNPGELNKFEHWGDGEGKRNGKSSGWLYKEAYDKYQAAEKALDEAVKKYQDLADQYEQLLNQLKGPWQYHDVNSQPKPNGAPLQNITFEKHKLPDDVNKVTTDYQDGYDSNRHPIDQYVSTCEIEKLTECDKSEEEENYIEYTDNTIENRNSYDVVYPQARPIWKQEDKNPATTQTVTVTCKHGTGPGNPFEPEIPGSGLTLDDFMIDFNPMYGPIYDYAAYNRYLEQQGWREEQTAGDAAAVAAGGTPVAPEAPTCPYVGSKPNMMDYPPYNPYGTGDYYTDFANWKAWQEYYVKLNQYNQNMSYFTSSGGTAFFTGSNPAAEAEHAKIMALLEQLNALEPQIQPAYDDMMKKKEEFDKTLEDFNKWSKAHAHDVVKFYNALQDYYTASQFDMESKIRDAVYSETTIFDEAAFFTEAAYEYEFTTLISQARADGKTEKVKFRDVFKEFRAQDAEVTEENEDMPTTQELKLYYELWQNYAKYATNLPQSGKYINWWTPEVQLLFMVGGSYNAETDKGLKVRDEYLNQACGQCEKPPERDTTGKYYYDWMSSWKGDDYTGRDLTTATRNFYYDMISGGFDDGTLKIRTEYAYAYYYMFQYNSPYQQAINYASVGGEASQIMDEMIAEGRWQTNTSNTLSDAAMPHNDKWKEYQKPDGTNRWVLDKNMSAWDIDTSTTLSGSMLRTLGEKQSHSRVNLLTDIWNGCQYINVIDNSTIGNAAMYLVDDPLIYGDKGDKFYKMKYGDGENSATEPVSNLAKVVYHVINRRLAENGKTAMSGEINDSGFNFVKTSILWSGMDIEFENITSVDELEEYLKETTSSVWQDTEDYQTDPDSEKKIGRGNSKIWEQRKLGPYYDASGNPFYRYKWYLVPRVLDDSEETDTDLGWYDDARNDDAERGFGDPTEDLDKWDTHKVDEHDTNNTPSKAKGEDQDGYKRKVNEDNERIADWIRVDWECWDKKCEECGGKGGHGNFDLLVPGDIIIHDGNVWLWLGEETVQNMYPLQKDKDPALVIAGGDEPTKLKSIDDVGFEWSKPCDSYVDHETPCPDHGALSTLPKEPETKDERESKDPKPCEPYDPEGKWTVYRLITPNYTDAYRSAGVIFNPADDIDYETWYKYKYRGMDQYAYDEQYLQEVREELEQVIKTDYPRDRR